MFSTLQRTHRLPKEMTPVEPSDFAAQLIARLEKLKREQDTMSSLEERLQQIQEVRGCNQTRDVSTLTKIVITQVGALMEL